MEFITNSDNDTIKLGERLAKTLKGGEVILLNGNLGAGKTVFSKGVCKGLGVESIVTSPTFVYLHEYEGKFKVFHFDLYRIENEEEVYELDLEHYLYEGGVSLIEWNKFKNIKAETITVNIKPLSEHIRQIEIFGAEI